MWFSLAASTAVGLFLAESVSASASAVKIDFKIKKGEPQLRELYFQHPSLVKRDSDSPVEIALPNEESYYLANITLGSPGQPIGVLIDTGSSDLWVQSSQNPYCAKSAKREISPKKVAKDNSIDYSSETLAPYVWSITESATPTETDPASFVTEIDTATISATQECSVLGIYNPDKSDSYHNNDTEFFIQYGDLTFAYGTWGYDDFSIGNYSVKNLSFGLANMSNSTQGVLGIGYTALESSENLYLNLPAKMAADGLISKNLYSLYLNNHDETGSILFGAVDHSKYTGTLSTLPTINQYAGSGYTKPVELRITLSGGTVNGKTVVNDKYAVLLDSGTTYTNVPTELFVSVNEAMGAKLDENLGAYITQCSKSDFNVTWNFSGANITVPAREYLTELIDSSNNVVTDKSGEPLCVSTIMSGGDASDPIFGDVFLRSAYVVFDLDLDQISIAQANYDGGAEDIEIVSSTVPSAVSAAGYSASWVEEILTTAQLSYETDTFNVDNDIYAFQSTVQWDSVGDSTAASTTSAKSGSHTSASASHSGSSGSSGSSSLGSSSSSSSSSASSSSDSKSSSGFSLNSNGKVFWNTILGSVAALGLIFVL